MNVPLALGVGFLTSQLALFATTIYLHRGITHKGLTMRPATALPFRFILWVSTGIRPREWAGVHRRHHAALDTVDDPHSPAIVGFWNVQLLNIVMYHRAAHDRAQVDRYTRDIPKNWLDRYVFDRETLGPLIGVGLPLPRARLADRPARGALPPGLLRRAQQRHQRVGPHGRARARSRTPRRTAASSR